MTPEDSRQALGRLEGKMDLLLSGFNEFKSNVREDNEDTDNRLKSLEIWRSRSTGYAAGGGAVVLILYEFVKNLFLGG